MTGRRVLEGVMLSLVLLAGASLFTWPYFADAPYADRRVVAGLTLELLWGGACCLVVLETR